MMKALDYLSNCKGGIVARSSIGHGTFINLEIEKDYEVTKLWIYLAEWALLIGDREIIASDMSDEDFSKSRDNMSILRNQEVTGLEVVGEKEVHIYFSGQFRIEIWGDAEKYEEDDPIIRIYLQGRHVADL